MSFKYSQPSFYHFNQDSLDLVSFIKKDFLASDINLNIADLCCGSGVIGIELSLILHSVSQLLLVEMQNSFMVHLERNKKVARCEESIIIESSLSDFNTKSYELTFDLVVANPPYFTKGAGRISPDGQRQMCRTFEKDSLKDLLFVMEQLLSPNGQAYFLSRLDNRDIKTYLKDNKITLVKKLGESGIFRLIRE